MQCKYCDTINTFIVQDVKECNCSFSWKESYAIFKSYMISLNSYSDPLNDLDNVYDTIIGQLEQKMPSFIEGLIRTTRRIVLISPFNLSKSVDKIVANKKTIVQYSDKLDVNIRPASFLILYEYLPYLEFNEEQIEWIKQYRTIIICEKICNSRKDLYHLDLRNRILRLKSGLYRKQEEIEKIFKSMNYDQTYHSIDTTTFLPLIIQCYKITENVKKENQS